jgi:hypothetical protein
MRVQLPKPLHGWRAFVGEVGIIVIGVLIALGAQQIAETVHWRFETAELRESLHREIKDNLTNAAFQVMIAPCIRGRIQKLHSQLAQGRAIWSADPVNNGEDARWQALPVALKVSDVAGFYTSGHWQTALASSALAHMPESERNGYSYAYRAIADLGSYAAEEDRIAARLQPLAMQQRVTDEQRVAFETYLASLDRVNALLTIYSRKFLEGNRRAGIVPRREDADQLFQLAQTSYGSCATPVGSTSDALIATYYTSKPQTD